jgi:hypothetical protein
MERLHKDVLIQIAARIYYPTQLINLCLTSSAFRCLGVNEILFRMFWLRAFYKFSPDFVLKYQPPPNWTWKEVFICRFLKGKEAGKPKNLHKRLTRLALFALKTINLFLWRLKKDRISEIL